FYDTVKAYYQFNINHKLSNEAAVIFNNGMSPSYKKIKPLLLTYTGWTAADSALLRRNKFIAEETVKIKSQEKKVQTLESVTVKARQKSAIEKLDEEYASGLFGGGDAYSFDLLNDQSSSLYQDIFTFLQGRVAGLLITTNGSGTTLQWRNSSPNLYLNEMQVDVSQIKTLPVSDVAYVKVFRPGSGLGFGGSAGGTIAVYTKKGQQKAIDPTIKGLDQARIIGYSVSRQFY